MKYIFHPISPPQSSIFQNLGRQQFEQVGLCFMKHAFLCFVSSAYVPFGLPVCTHILQGSCTVTGAIRIAWRLLTKSTRAKPYNKARTMCFILVAYKWSIYQYCAGHGRLLVVGVAKSYFAPISHNLSLDILRLNDAYFSMTVIHCSICKHHQWFCHDERTT